MRSSVILLLQFIYNVWSCLKLSPKRTLIHSEFLARCFQLTTEHLIRHNYPRIKLHIQHQFKNLLCRVISTQRLQHVKQMLQTHRLTIYLKMVKDVLFNDSFEVVLNVTFYLFTSTWVSYQL